jgi:hypothetical protein
MGIIKETKKFKRTIEQSNPTNPKGIANKINANDYDIDKRTIKEQKNKK